MTATRPYSRKTLVFLIAVSAVTFAAAITTFFFGLKTRLDKSDTYKNTHPYYKQTYHRQ